MADQVMRAVRFSIQTDYGKYNDTLWYTESDYASLGAQDIEDAKQARVDSWVQKVTNPPAYKEPTQEQWREFYVGKQEEADEAKAKIVYTKEELEAQKADLLVQADSLQDKIDGM